MRWYKQLDYSSDAFLEAYGRSLEEAFANAARAMLSVMMDVRRISGKKLADRCEVEGYDLENLLYNWLECILNKFMIENKVFSRFKLAIEKKNSGYRLTAELRGEYYSRDKHGVGREVKGVTYHQMWIGKRDDGLYAVRFLLDL